MLGTVVRVVMGGQSAQRVRIHWPHCGCALRMMATVLLLLLLLLGHHHLFVVLPAQRVTAADHRGTENRENKIE